MTDLLERTLDEATAPEFTDAGAALTLRPFELVTLRLARG